MNTNDKSLFELLDKGYILYYKDGKLKAEQIPKFGSITFNYQDNKLNYIEKKETIK